jgi:hypothetical protein
MKASKYADISFLFLPFVLLIFLTSCEIEDEHGTPEFVFGYEKNTSQQGDQITDYVTNTEFFVNEKAKEIYIVGCTTQDGWCENQTIYSINYESGSEFEVFTFNRSNSNVQIIRNQPIVNRLLFTEFRYGTGKLVLYSIDLDTHKYHEISDIIVNEYSVAANKEFVFYHYEYDSLFIIKSDFDEKTELLNIRGEIVYALPDMPEIIVQNPTDGKYSIYNYELDSVVFEKTSSVYPWKFYSFESEIFYLDDYYTPSIKMFKSDMAIYHLSNEGNFMDFNPICDKVVVWKAYPTDQNAYFQPLHSRLIVEDLDEHVFTTPVSLYDEWIDFAKILNDGKTIFYETMEGKLYQTTIE